ncbi:unnamed protein product [Brachionus calyciflorus]|uniref:protein-serine/threonine phosphatase n=1 Tax=Brachionus calyciflorus TaxID=104777 RepID=A0A813UY73_9BILA|nr:unnamed protein product [Brachionus calyciflorus]
MDVSQKLLLTTQGDINNNTQLLSDLSQTNKLHTSKTTSSVRQTSNVDINLIRKSNTTNTLNNNNEYISTNENLNNDRNYNSDIESDNDNANSPLKSNVNRNLSHDLDNKTIRKSRGKNLFKTLFCCFSSHRGNLKSPKNGLISHTNTSQSAQGLLNSNSPTANNLNNNNNIDNLSNSTFYSNDNKENFNNDNSNGQFISNNNSNYPDGKKLTNITNNNYNTSSRNTNGSNPIALSEKPLLPPINPNVSNKKCLIIDLDETLVHSSFKQVYNADFIVPVEIDGTVHQVYVLKRPYVDEFLKKMGELYECVLFTASLAKYADPVADLLDKWGVFSTRLFREACVYFKGNYVKDLSRLGRDLNSVIILDNSPASYLFHPENALPCTSWFDDMNDTELYDLIPYFERLANVDSVYPFLKQFNQNQQFMLNQASSSYVQQQMEINNQQVPTGLQSLIYQQQQQQQQQETRNSGQTNNLNYMLNENKILLSIDMMMATKQQQLQQQQQQQNQINNSTK